MDFWELCAYNRLIDYETCLDTETIESENIIERLVLLSTEFNFTFSLPKNEENICFDYEEKTAATYLGVSGCSSSEFFAFPFADDSILRWDT